MSRKRRGRLRKPESNDGQRIGKQEESSGSTQNQTPLFCFHHLGGDFCLSHCDQEEKAAFADTVHKLSRVSWAEIARSHRHAIGTEIISRDSLTMPLPSSITDDVNILAFRFHGKAPMLGYREGRTFHVLGLDKSFKAYRH